MIVYGISMQNKPQKVPKEVAVWILERNMRYPLIDFKIDYSDYADPQTETIRQKYSRLYDGTPTGLPCHGVRCVSFLYLQETWFVRIIGGSDTEGKIADMNIPQDSNDPHRSVDGLSAEQRADIVDMPSLGSLERIQERTYGLPRTSGEFTQERGTLIDLPADMCWKSDFVLSGESLANFADLFHGQPSERKTEIIEALSRKDYETAKRLLKEQN